jgi:hypothetical protein
MTIPRDGTVNLSASGQGKARGLRSGYLKMGDLAPRRPLAARDNCEIAFRGADLEEVGDRVDEALKLLR